MCGTLWNLHARRALSRLACIGFVARGQYRDILFFLLVGVRSPLLSHGSSLRHPRALSLGSSSLSGTAMPPALIPPGLQQPVDHEAAFAHEAMMVSNLAVAVLNEDKPELDWRRWIGATAPSSCVLPSGSPSSPTAYLGGLPAPPWE